MFLCLSCFTHRLAENIQPTIKVIIPSQPFFRRQPQVRNYQRKIDTVVPRLGDLASGPRIEQFFFGRSHIVILHQPGHFKEAESRQNDAAKASVARGLGQSLVRLDEWPVVRFLVG